jgi:plasmid stabilization system protein ParE
VILRILANAEAEIEAARRYLNRQSLELGGRFLDDLAERLAAIAEDPLRFPKLETLPDDQPYRRALLTVFRYAVVFEVLDKTIVVVALAHTSRAPNYWLGR